jgi:hypothetical protein
MPCTRRTQVVRVFAGAKHTMLGWESATPLVESDTLTETYGPSVSPISDAGPGSQPTFHAEVHHEGF